MAFLRGLAEGLIPTGQNIAAALMGARQRREEAKREEFRNVFGVMGETDPTVLRAKMGLLSPTGQAQVEPLLTAQLQQQEAQQFQAQVAQAEQAGNVEHLSKLWQILVFGAPERMKKYGTYDLGVEPERISGAVEKAIGAEEEKRKGVWKTNIATGQQYNELTGEVRDVPEFKIKEPDITFQGRLLRKQPDGSYKDVTPPGFEESDKENKDIVVEGSILRKMPDGTYQEVRPKKEVPFKPTGEALNKANMYRSANAGITELTRMLDDPRIGPILDQHMGPYVGRWDEWRMGTFGDVGVPAELITFQSLIKNVVDLQLRARTGAAAPEQEKEAFDMILGTTKFSLSGTRNRLNTTKAQNQREIDVIYTPYNMPGTSITQEDKPSDLSGVSNAEISRRALGGDEEAIAEARRRGLL